MNTIKKLREAKNIKQYELAKEMGVIRQTISALECGSTNPSVDLLKKLADYFEVTTDEILGRETKIDTA